MEDIKLTDKQKIAVDALFREIRLALVEKGIEKELKELDCCDKKGKRTE
jgi:hypothetical protein